MDSPKKRIKVGTIFRPVINGREMEDRRDVVVGVSGNDFFVRTLFHDGEGKDSFRPFAGGTAGPENIGSILGKMRPSTIRKLRETERRGIER